jgi:hypothetical protein
MRLVRRSSITAWLLALGTAAAGQAQGVLVGRLSTGTSPLPAARVYAYQLASATLDRAATDLEGGFRFEGLPAGLYKIVAFKPGFVPAVALLTRASAEAAQYVEMDLRPEAPADGDDFWSVRRQIPPDVLRDIDMAAAVAAWNRDGQAQGRRLWGEMGALAGVDGTLADQDAPMTGGSVDLEAAIRDVRVDLAGNYLEVLPSAGGPQGHSQSLSLGIAEGGAHRVQLTSQDDRLRQPDDPVSFESHRLAWSHQGQTGETRVAAQYTQESNYFGSSDLGTLWLPQASRSWRLEGSYSAEVGEASRVEGGVRYREREADLADDRFTLPDERVEVFGLGGTRLNPTLLVEYGLVTTLADGSLSLAPQGSLVVRLSPTWRARTSASVEVHDEATTDSLLQDFRVLEQGELASCDGRAEQCVQVTFSQHTDGRERFTIGALHRLFDETLWLQFDRNFFNRDENLILAPGDQVPELQVALTRRLAPRVESRFESTFGAGGGGTLWAGPRPRPYTNEVAYLVTSMDTRFQATQTGVFLALHHLAQRLDSASGRQAERLVQMQRLELALTQELDILHELASDFAVQLNMELSRGLQAVSRLDRELDDPDDVRSRVSGGVAVRF